MDQAFIKEVAAIAFRDGFVTKDTTPEQLAEMMPAILQATLAHEAKLVEDFCGHHSYMQQDDRAAIRTAIITDIYEAARAS